MTISTTGQSKQNCIVVADGARARVLTTCWQDDPMKPDSERRGDRLEERQTLINPSHRIHDSENYAETRPGLQQNGPGGRRQGVDDHRQAHREQETHRFAGEVAEAIAKICEDLGHCRLLLLATPNLLGELRDALAKHPESTRHVSEQIELDRDLTHLTPPELREWLVSSNLLPPRRRGDQQ